MQKPAYVCREGNCDYGRAGFVTPAMTCAGCGKPTTQIGEFAPSPRSSHPGTASVRLTRQTTHSHDIPALARKGFEAYNLKAGGKAYDGSPIPGWNEARPDIREKWEASTRAIVEALYAERGS